MSEEQAKAFLETATQALQSGQFAQALEFVEQSIALKPESSEAFVLKGIAHSQLGQPDEATTAFRQAIMFAPYNVKAYFNLAVHYYALGQKPAAEEMAREAVRIEPKHAGARDLLARIEAESQPQGTSQPSVASPHDPLSQQPHVQGAQGATPPVVEGSPGIPVGGQLGVPAQPQNPYQAPAGQQYYRQGYANPSVHSIAFIERMGKSWDTVGLVIGGVVTILGAISLVIGLAPFMKHGMDLQAIAADQQAQSFGPGMIMFALIGFLSLVMSLIWMIMDITDRRGNWLWLLPFLICCCCRMAGPILLIYIWKGRD